MQVAKGFIGVMRVPMIRVGVYDRAAAIVTNKVNARFMQTTDVRRVSTQLARMCIADRVRQYSTPRSKLPVPVIETEENEQPLIYNRPQQRRRKPWYTSPVVYVLMIVPMFTFWLGNWQLRRLQWKLDLIDELEDKLNSKPLHLPRHINLDVLEEFAFRLVSLKGRFDPSRTLFLGPRAREGERGYDLVMPFHRAEGGGDVLVNCGFVSNAFIEGTNMDKHLKHPLPFQGEVTLTTLLPRVYPPSRFALPNEPNNNLWMQVNPAQMAAWLNEQSGAAQNTTSEKAANRGFSPRDLWPFSKPEEPLSPSKAFQQKSNQVLPVYLEQVFDGTFSEAGANIRQGIPVGRPPKINLRNQHMEYAVTWFTLSGISSLMFIYMVSRGRGV
ncbi:surf-like protein [Malassezia yamatoensis]|uniref:SURF1-like protein n=1 Tax=Malassezia yamatoensis TaxID=253288 RepID=A0AAJ5YUM4_9BASI|nr:surf-like protein [Malassezia yamatoensis]